jgi:N12 class adenine-specific DNA methylase
LAGPPTIYNRPYAGDVQRAATPGGPNQFLAGLRGGLQGDNVTATGNFTQAIADAIESERLHKIGEKIEAAGNSGGAPYQPRVGRLRDIGSVQDALDYAGYQTGKVVASSLPSVVGAVAGTAIGGPVGGVLGAGAASLVQNVGDVEQELEDIGVTDPKQRAKYAFEIGTPIAALDILPAERLAGKLLGKGAAKAATEAAAKRGLFQSLKGTAKEVAKQGALEATTEVAQEEIQLYGTRAAAGMPTPKAGEALERGAEAGVAAFLGGGAMGGAVHVGQDVRERMMGGRPSDAPSNDPPSGPPTPGRAEPLLAPPGPDYETVSALDDLMDDQQAAVEPEPEVVPEPEAPFTPAPAAEVAERPAPLQPVQAQEVSTEPGLGVQPDEEVPPQDQQAAPTPVDQNRPAHEMGDRELADLYDQLDESGDEMGAAAIGDEIDRRRQTATPAPSSGERAEVARSVAKARGEQPSALDDLMAGVEEGQRPSQEPKLQPATDRLSPDLQAADEAAVEQTHGPKSAARVELRQVAPKRWDLSVTRGGESSSISGTEQEMEARARDEYGTNYTKVPLPAKPATPQIPQAFVPTNSGGWESSPLGQPEREGVTRWNDLTPEQRREQFGVSEYVSNQRWKDLEGSTKKQLRAHPAWMAAPVTKPVAETGTTPQDQSAPPADHVTRLEQVAQQLAQSVERLQEVQDGHVQSGVSGEPRSDEAEPVPENDAGPATVRSQPGRSPSREAGSRPARADAGRESRPERQPREDGARGESPAESAGDRHGRGDGEGRALTAGNYRLTPEDRIGAGSAKQKAEGNLAAIRLLKDIEAAGRPATTDEQAALAKYVGWGGLPNAFNADHSDYLPALRKLLDDKEYEAARGSTLNAHYTSPEVIDAIYQALRRLGVTGGRFLEPSMGVGNFLGLTPSELRAKWTGVELDPITGRIAKLLYPASDIRVHGFEQLKVPDGTFDVAVSNVPFGNYRVNDVRYNKLKLNIHNYFFAKALDLVRPGGIVAFVTSRYTLDQVDSSFRQYVKERADFLGAFRLPENAFKANAGTEVVTDVIFLRRREEGAKIGGVADWLTATAITTPEGQSTVNEYYAEHPAQILGEQHLERGMHRDKEYTVTPIKGAELKEQMARAIEWLQPGSFLPAKIDAPGTRPDAETVGTPAPGRIKEGGYVVENGVLKRREGERMVAAQVPKAQLQKITQLARIQDAVREVIRTQREDRPEGEIVAARKELNRHYDRFVKEFGPIAREVRTEITPKKGKPYEVTRYPNIKPYMADPDVALLFALEKYDPETDKAQKSDLLTTRTIQARQPVEHVDTPQDALPVVLNDIGRVDVGRIAALAGTTPEEAVKALAGAIYEDPTSGEWETSDGYLSGDVRAKLTLAKAAAKKDPRFHANVEALEAVQPEDLQPSDIAVGLGSPWVPTGDVEQFITDTFGPGKTKVRYIPSEAKWNVQADYRQQYSGAATNDFGTSRVNGTHLLELALNLKQAEVFDKDRDGNRVKNLQETLAAQEKQQKLKDRFAAWVWEDQARASRLARYYNDHFNNLRVRSYDGSHLTLPGMAAVVNGKPFKLDQHQRDAVWRILQTGNTLLAHVVGAGKTYTMVAAGMEAKRLGLAMKPMYTVPNHMLGQFSREFLQLYPSAQILVTEKEDLTAEGRARFQAKITGTNWDAVIMTHRSFESVPMSVEAQTAFIRKEIEALEDLIRAEKADTGDKVTVKELEKSKKRREAKLQSLMAEEKKDDLLEFESLGVDMVFVDEAHLFKNLEIASRQRGMATEGSQRSFDLYLKSQYLDSQTPGRGLVFATGTPIANAMAEMFTMQRYLQRRVLEAHGLAHFDAWVAQFGEPVTALELAPDGSGYRINTRLAAYKNVPELIQMFRTVADVKMADDLKLPKPTLIGGKAVAVVSPKTPALAEYVARLIKRAEAVRAKKVDPSEDNFLKITGDGRYAAMDMRFVDMHAGANPESKVYQAADRIAEQWRETKDLRGAQLVFSDIGTPGGEGQESKRGGVDGFTVYHELREALVHRGVPGNEIAFIHDATSDEKKAKLFQAVKAGRIRILVGSTEKMGAGTNVQDRLVAEHHLDAPWRPADIEQREGRILRQGNLLFNDGLIPGVRIFRYVTEGSFDAYMWQTLERKAKMIAQVMKGELTRRTIKDEDVQALDFATMKAITSGNPMVLEKAGVDADVAKLDRLRKAHLDSQFKLKQELLNLPKHVDYWADQAAGAQEDKGRIQDVSGDKFTVTIQGKEYSKRAEAAAALRSALGSFFARNAQGIQAGQDPQEQRLGTFAGFDLYLMPSIGSLSRAKIGLRGALTYASDITGDDTDKSLLATLEHIPGRIDRMGEDAKLQVQTAQKRIRELEERAGAPFDKQAELTAKLQRQKELDAALTKVDEPKPDEAPPTDEDEDDEDGEGGDGVVLGSLLGGFQPAIERALKRWKERQAQQEAIAPSALEDVEERWQAAKGLEPEGVRAKLEKALQDLRAAGRHFADIDPAAGTLEALTNEILLEIEHAQSWAQTTAYDKVREVTDGLSEPEVDLLTRHFALSDLQKDLEAGLYEGKDLPFGYPDAEAVENDLESVRRAVSDNPTVNAAVERRQKFAQALVRELVAVEQLPAEVLKDERYYHRQVLEYFNDQQPQHIGTGAQDARVKRKGFQRGRVGGGDFNTRYHEAEFEWVAQAYRILHMVRSLEKIKQLADIQGRLKLEAKSLNKERLAEKLNSIEAAAGLRVFAQRIGMATGQLTKLVADGTVDVPGFEHLTLALSRAYRAWAGQERRAKGEGPRPAFRFDHPDWFRFLNRLVTRNEAGAKEAATIFKAIREREEWVKEQLGRDYATWETLVPSGYTTWQPVKGNYFFPALTVSERAIQQVLNGERELQAAVQEAMVLAGPRETWVIPEWLASTMDGFGHQREISAAGRAWTYLEGKWKQYQLLMPIRAAKYNLNNAVGDLDATLLYPGIATHSLQAARDLLTYVKGDAPAALKEEMQDANRRRILDQGLTVAEIPELGTLPAFERLAGSDPRTFMEWLWNLGPAYFRHARRITQLRENILRLAAYRYFLAEMKAGRTGILGASNRERLSAFRDHYDRAAILTRDLIGDYGNISAAGQYLRERVFPFFSWQEINAKRYFNIFRNIGHEGAPSKSRLFGFLGKKVAVQAGKRLLQVNLFFLLAALWNHLLWPDEEEEMRQRGRNLHLILGRNPDGSINAISLQGAFADFLEWLNLADYPADVKDLLDGTRSVKDKLIDGVLAPLEKIVGMWEPVSKTLFEVLTKRATYPTPRDTRPIRDRAEHVANGLALGWLYREVTDIPNPPGSGITQFLLTRTDPGEAAYFGIRQKASDWQEAHGKERGMPNPTARDNSLYYWRKALEWGQEERADRWLARYYQMGGKKENARAAIKRAAPLKMLSEGDRGAFRRSLSPDDRQMLDLAERWYRHTLKGQAPGSLSRTPRRP